MDDPEGPQLIERLFFGTAWLWLGVAGLFALLSGMAADGCSDSACDTRVTIGWVILMAAQIGVVVAAVFVGSRMRDRRRIWATVVLMAVSALTVVGFFWYAGWAVP